MPNSSTFPVLGAVSHNLKMSHDPIYGLLFALITSYSIFNLPLADAQVVAPRASELLKNSQIGQEEDVSVKTRGVISRSELNHALKGGVPHLLAQARLSPARRDGRFYGFILSELRSLSTAERAGFQVGDVIMNVNDEPIGRPEQMMHLLSTLAFAQTLVVRFEREGVVKEWTWLIRE